MDAIGYLAVSITLNVGLVVALLILLLGIAHE